LDELGGINLSQEDQSWYPAIDLHHPRALHVVILWGSLPLARQDCRVSQFHRCCLQAKALTPMMMITVIAVTIITIIAVTVFIVSDEERLF
jgi:hypothetical protein